MSIFGLDHLVLTVPSVQKTVVWYESALGFRHVEEHGRHSLHFGHKKINLHEVGRAFEPKALHPTPGSGDLCFISEVSVEQIAGALQARDVEIEVVPSPEPVRVGR